MSTVSAEISEAPRWSPRQLLRSCRDSAAPDLRVMCASGSTASTHAVVLSQASTAAFSMLSVAVSETETEPVVVLATEYSLRSVEAMLRLMYDGVATLVTDDSEEVLALCKAIGMTGVAPVMVNSTEMCDEDFVKQAQVDLSLASLPRASSPSSASSSSSSSSSSASSSSTSSRSSVISDVPKEGSALAEWNENEENVAEKVQLTVKLEENLGRSKTRLEEQEVPNESSKPSATEESSKSAAPSITRVFMSQLDPAQLTCSICGKRFTALYRLKLHQLIHSDTFPFSCNKCSKGFNNKYKMRVHAKKCSGAPKLVRPKSATAKKPASEAKSTKQTHECVVCGESFEAKAALAVHLAASHPDYRKFSCSLCGKGFRGQKALDRHAQSSCPSARATSAPRPTPAPTGPPTSLATPTPSTTWRCQSCPTTCSSRKSLKIHCKVAHLEGGPDALPFKCGDDQCGKAFLKQSYLEEHAQRFHSSERQFACMYCPKLFSTKQDLSRHLSSHDGRARFACEWCDRAFVHRANRAQHVMAAHTGERPYACRPCNRTFGLLCVLRKHQKAHIRKGDNTVLVTAPKGRRGCISYIDFADAQADHRSDHEKPPLVQPSFEQQHQLQEPAPTSTEAPGGLFPVDHVDHPVYIPGVQYLPQRRRRTFTPLSQMQVVAEDFGVAPAPSMGVATGQNFGMAFAVAPDGNTVAVDEFAAFGIEGEAYPADRPVVHQPQQVYDASSYQSVQPEYYYPGAHYAPHPLHGDQPQPLPAIPGQTGVQAGPGYNMQSAASEEMTETEAIAMDLMGLFTEPSAHATQTPIQHL